jgi:hypothetical protein
LQTGESKRKDAARETATNSALACDLFLQPTGSFRDYAGVIPSSPSEKESEKIVKSRTIVAAFALRLLAFTVGHSISSVSLAHAQEASHTAIPEFPGFDVRVTLSEKAEAKFAASKETIIVAGYLSGDPKKQAAKKYVDEMGQVGLGTIKTEIQPGQIAHFADVKVKKDAFAQIDINGPQLLINVYSGRKSSKDNLLDCGIYEGALKPVGGTTIPIACKLIGE